MNLIYRSVGVCRGCRRAVREARPLDWWCGRCGAIRARLHKCEADLYLWLESRAGRRLDSADFSMPPEES